MEKKSSLTHKDLWNQIFPFLEMSDYYSLELCNRNFKNILNTYYQLKTKNLSNSTFQKNPKKIFFSVYKNSFVVFNVKEEFNSLEESEQLKVTNVDGNQNKNYKKISIESRLIDNSQTIHKSEENTLFSQGNIILQIVVKEKIFILYHNGDFKIFSCDSSGNYEFEMKFNFAYLNIKKFVFFEQISTIIMINTSGNLFSLYYPKISDLVEINQDDQQIYITMSEIENLHIIVNDIYSLTDYLILIDDKDHIFYIHLNNVNSFCGKKNNLDEEKQKSEEIDKIKLISFDKNYGKILKISNTDENIMLIDNSYRIFYINTNDLNKPGTVERAPKVIYDFKFKLIQDISCGDNHWLVLEREDMKPLDKWNQEEVQQWFIEMGMDEYGNIIKYEKIKGKDIIEGDESFYVNVMGLKDDQYKKLKYEINKVKNTSCRKSTLWGWGSNKFGQLGQINYSNNYIKQPTVINLPNMKDENDYVVNVYCGKKYSLLLTKFGELYITGNYLLKEKAANLVPVNTSNQNSKVDKKHKTPMKSKVVTQAPTYHRWVNITKDVCFNTVNEKNFNHEYFFKAKEISLRGSKIFIFGYKSNAIPFTLQEKKPKLKHLKKGEKFPTSDSVIQDILLKKKSSIDKILVVYDDSLLKLLETPLEEFLESEVPYHKIIQIKFYNSIIWDRKKRYFNLDFK